MNTARHVDLTNQRLRQRLQEQVAINELGESLMDWLSDSTVIRSASIDKLSSRLEMFRLHVERYFGQELELTDALLQRGGPTDQIKSARSRTTSQRRSLLKRLDAVIRDLKSFMPGSEEWHEAVYEFGLISDAIDLYEDAADDLVSLVGGQQYE